MQFAHSGSIITSPAAPMNGRDDPHSRPLEGPRRKRFSDPFDDESREPCAEWKEKAFGPEQSPSGRICRALAPYPNANLEAAILGRPIRRHDWKRFFRVPGMDVPPCMSHPTWLCPVDMKRGWPGDGMGQDERWREGEDQAERTAEVGGQATSGQPERSGVIAAPTGLYVPETTFDELGQLPRHGSRTVFTQGSAPTCGPTSAGMVLDTFGIPMDLPAIIQKAIIGPRGVKISSLAKLLQSEGVDARFHLCLPVETLKMATARGNPAIVAVLQGGVGHAVVVDGITIRQGVPVVAVRDPWGRQYFERMSDFHARYYRQGVTTRGRR